MSVPDSQLLASVLVEQLITDRVTDLVLAPGSRSAPIAYAAWQARDRLRLHVRIDERSAGYLALGLAKASGTPVPVVVTSGTAAGNLLPAMMEAFHSRVPLVAITANRPATMIDTGANQTTEQFGLFGRHVRAETRVSAPDRHPRAWAGAIDRALASSIGGRGGVAGPVHLEVALTDPLVPTGDHRPDPRPMIQINAAERPGQTVVACGSGTVVVAGDLSPHAGHRLAEEAARARVPLLAEPTSNARHSDAAISTYRLLLETSLADRIDQVVMVGRPTLSRPVQRLLARSDVDLVAVDPTGEWIDPGNSARLIVADLALGHTDGQTLDRWRTADRTLLAALDREASADPGGPGLCARGVVAAVVAAAADQCLVLGSSNPVRDADLVAFPHRPGQLYANRGLAGIDGLVSTAYGIALAGPHDRATWALCGDLTFLHDGNGLLVGPDEPRPRALRYMVVNDDGGSIFATLEHGAPERSATFERLFGTPHHTDLAALCASHGISHTRVADLDHLEQALAAPVDGVEVVEAVVSRTDRHGQNARWQALATAAVAAL